MSNIAKKKLKIEGMHCTACAMNIDFDLEDLKGVKTARTNYAKQVCEVEYDEKQVNDEDIIKSIKKTGYSASLL